MDTRVPFFAMSRIDEDVSVEGSISRVVGRSQYILGPEVRQFEQGFADYCGVEHCIGVANGTDALEIALRALGIGPRNRVVMVANAGNYASTAVRTLSAEPVYVDVDPVSLTMSPPSLGDALTRGASAVIVTHLYGQLADMKSILPMTNRRNVPVIEDCAQAHGARSHGESVGSFGALGCFSFYPTKNLGAIGDGGAITTSDAELAHRVRSLREYGWDRRFRVALRGGRNSRLDEIQAAVLADRLPHLDDWNSERRDIAHRYQDGLRDLPLTLPLCCGEDYVAHLYVVRSVHRDGLRAYLTERGIGSSVHYPIADHRQPAYRDGQEQVSLPNTDVACETAVSLPCYPGLSPVQQGMVVDAVRSFHDDIEG